jgi:hypothetical protein
MSRQEPGTTDLLARLRRLFDWSNEKLGEIFDESRLDEIRQWTRRRFSEGAQKLDLPALQATGRKVDRLLEGLLKGTRGRHRDAGERLEGGEARQGSAPGAAGGRRRSEDRPPGQAGAAGRSEVGQEPTELDVQVSKFDIARIEEVAEEGRTLPWGYGKTRTTGMVIDADRLFTYWEVTDPAIEAARAGLGPGGAGAWLNLRVYDVTDRLFDGTNAHSYFDQKVERTDRQWFFHIGKPGSSAVVELGMKSDEGFFVKVVRSGRVDFPRREPSAAADVEWLTVRPDTGEIAHHAIEHHPQETRFGGGAGAPIAVVDWEAGRANGHPQGDGEDRMVALLPGEIVARRWDWQVIFPSDWQEIRRILSWEGPLIRTSWEAGPFFVPVELPSRIEEYHTGGVQVTSREGSTRVIYGPWRVVIRGLGAHAERRVLGVWEMTRTWTEGPLRLSTTGWAEGRSGPGVDTARPGASELLARGASELLVRGASELRLGGASEVFYLGASEVQLGGASETLHLGASEVRVRGASEVRLGGASEWRFRGASEQVLGGASEVGARGASELRLGGASELSFGRASEARLGDAGAMQPRGPLHPDDGGSTGYPPIEGEGSAGSNDDSAQRKG